MDNERFPQDHSRGGRVEKPEGQRRRPWLGDWAEAAEWDSGSGVTEQWGVGNTFGGVHDSLPTRAEPRSRGYQAFRGLAVVAVAVLAFGLFSTLLTHAGSDRRDDAA